MRSTLIRTLLAAGAAFAAASAPVPATAVGTAAAATAPAKAAAPAATPARPHVDWAPPPTEADQRWRLPARSDPADNAATPERVELGQLLFFDPRLSGNGTVSCATCHNPSLGWSDGLRTGVGIHGQVLKRGTPTVANTAFVTQLMWDGRHRTLEEQALGPMRASDEMASDLPAVLERLASMPGYANRFRTAYPAEGVSERAVAKALAAFQRTIVVADSPFDRWLAGDRKALSLQAWRGYQVFVDPKKGNCAVCHSGANFTDNGFHNLGLASYGKENPDMGRYAQKPLPVLKGAFKTPTVREAANTGPYFHDGSARSLMEVVEHYDKGGDVRSNVSKDVRPLGLSAVEKRQLVAFMEALSSPPKSFELAALPR